MYSVTEMTTSVISTLSGREDCHEVIRDCGGIRILVNYLDPSLEAKVLEDVATALGNVAADCLCRSAVLKEGGVSSLLQLMRPSRQKRVRVSAHQQVISIKWIVALHVRQISSVGGTCCHG